MTHRTLGTCYYPEHWPDDWWAEDARRMVDAGLTWVRIGEFAWTRLEPRPGALQWDWLDRALDTLGQAGLNVVLGTPTATPPRWMLDKHPNMVAIGADGRPRGFGSRRHYCFSHQGYLDECRRIVTLLADRYGDHPHVHAWQTDNEYGCHDTVVSYSDSARDGFRDWCAQRYQSPQALNRAWGNVFWSMDYDSFDQIDLPTGTVTEPNPAHALAFRRYCSDAVVRFNRAQTDILRQRTDKPLLHNYMGREVAFDHFAVGADLDIATWDSYPLGFLEDRVPATDAERARFLRQGHPDMQAFHHDLYRAVGRGRWWVIEQQPGPVNWAAHNPAPLPGMARLWAWEAFAHGAETLCYFRWRQAPFAQEQHHAGLLRPDSQAAPALAECRQVADELAGLPDVGTATVQVALIFDYTSAWAWQIQPQGAAFDHFAICFDVYKGLRRLGLSIDIVPPDADLSRYKLVLAPGLMTLPDGFCDRPTGTAILGPRTNAKTAEMAIPVPLPPALPGLDSVVDLVETMPASGAIPLADGGVFQHWAEQLVGGAEVVEARADGTPALVRHGKLHYLGGWPDAEALHRVLRRACDAEGIATLDLPSGLRVRDTATHRFWFNYDAQAVEYDGRRIEAADLMWEPL